MIDHSFQQGLIWTEGPEGPEQVCQVCGQRAIFHGTRPAIYGRIPWPVVEELAKTPAPVVIKGRLSALLHRLAHPKPGPADHAFLTPEVPKGRAGVTRMGAR